MFRFIKSFFRADQAQGLSPHPVVTADPSPRLPASRAIPPADRSLASRSILVSSRPAAPPGNDLGDTTAIELPLKVILARLPEELQCRIKSVPPKGTTLRIACSTILQQLPRGAIRIPFSDLKAGSPPGLFNDGPGDESKIELPLPEILARLKPDQLPKRQGRKYAEIPSDVLPVFTADPADSGGAVSMPPVKSAPRPVAPTVEPGAVLNAPIPSLKLTPVAPIAPVAAAPVVDKPIAMPAGLDAPVPVQAASRLPLTAGTVTIPLDQLSGQWPEAVLKWVPMMEASLEIPVSELQPAIQAGRPVFSWKQVRGWIRPVINDGAAHDALPIELPLRVVVPLYMAAARPAATSRRHVTIEESIPDLFFGTSGPEEKSPVDLPDLALKGNESPRTPPSPPPDSSTPVGLVREACQIRGITGALITAADGLLVAAQLPQEVNSEALAAFVPQIFSRLSQSTVELKLGAPRQITASLDRFVLHLLPSGTAYLAILTAAGGDAVPQDRLAELASKLNKISNSH